MGKKKKLEKRIKKLEELVEALQATKEEEDLRPKPTVVITPKKCKAFCPDCEEMFIPHAQTNIYCDECAEKRNKPKFKPLPRLLPNYPLHCLKCGKVGTEAKHPRQIYCDSCTASDYYRK